MPRVSIRPGLFGLCVAALALFPRLAQAQIYVASSPTGGADVIGEYNFDGSVINANLVTGLGHVTAVSVNAGILYVLTEPGAGATSFVSSYNASTGALLNGTLITGLYQARGMAISGGQIYIASYTISGGPNQGSVGVYSLNGAAVNSGLITFLSYPIGLTVSGGNIYVTTDYESDIGVYNSTTGATVSTYLIAGNPLDAAYVAAIGNTVYVSNYAPYVIGAYDATTGSTVNASLLAGVNTGVGGVGQIVAAGGELFIIGGSGATIGEFNPDGSTVNASLITGLSGAAALAVAPPDLVVSYTTLNVGIGEYGLDGSTVNAALIGAYPALDSPEGLVGAGSNFYIADLNSDFSTVKEYSSSGSAVASPLVSNLDQAYQLALSGNTLYVSYVSYAGNAIGSYNATTGAAINAYLVTATPTVSSMVAAGGQIFTTNGIDGGVSAYNSDGSVANANLIPSLAHENTTAITALGSNLFVAYESTGGIDIGEYTTAGAPVNPTLISGLSYPPVAMVVYGQYLFVALGDQIGEYTISGATVNAALVTGISIPSGLTLVYAGASGGSGPTTPTVNWTTPAAITYGTPLGSLQLDATASTAGTFNYSPLAGTVLTGGTHTLNVTFNPTDTTDYTNASGMVNLTVNPATPTINWPAPAAIASGTTLSSTQLDATANTAGTFTYNPLAGTILSAGSHTLGVTFTPTDTTDYTTATGSVSITVNAPALQLAAVTLTGLTASYNGLPQPVTATTSPAGLSVLLTYNGSTAVPSAPGSYNVLAQIQTAGYQGIATAVLTIELNPNLPSVYFGSLVGGGSSSPASSRHADASGGATIGAYVNPGQTGGLLVGYIASLNAGFAASFTLSNSGSFSVTTPTLTASGMASQQLTISGQVSGLTLSGAIAPLNLSFSAALDTPGGSTSSLAGAYTASAVNSSGGSTYSIVGPQGDAFVLAVTPTVVAAGAGTVSSGGAITVQTAQSVTITEAVNPTAMTVSGTVAVSGGGTLNVDGLSATSAATNRLDNVSSLGLVGAGQNGMTVGFVVGGTGTETLLVRVVGPGLTAFGVTGVLAHPSLTVFDGHGSMIASNTGWGGSATLGAAFQAVGAFPLAAGSADAAALVTLPPGAYTVQVTNAGADNGGAALAEIYEVASGASTRLVNLSARGTVAAGTGSLVGGFYVGGNAPETVLIRGDGPSLAQFGVTGVMSSTVLTVYASGTLIGQNSGWGNQAASGPTVSSAAAITTAATSAGAFPFASGSLDSALILTLAPGAYTAQLAGKDGAGGAGMIEVYELAP